MKNIFKYFVPCLVCVLLIGWISSCEEDNKTQTTSCSGTPKLVSITSTTDFNTTFNSCNLGDWITLHGEQLCATQSILVNGIEVNMREVFLEQDKITLQVPRLIPEKATNQIEVSNGTETSKVNCTVAIPNLDLYGLDNEYANAGDTIKVNGFNFDLYEITKEKGKIYIGEKQVPILNTTDKYVTMIMPSGTNEGDRIRVVGPSVDKYAPGRYKDTRGIFENFDPYYGWSHTENITNGTNAGDPKPCSGQFTHIVKELGAWEWYDFIASWYTLDEDIFAHPEKYVYKFEVLTLKSLTKKTVGINQTNYQWKPWEAGEFTTYGKWKTITVEFKDVMNGKNADAFPTENGKKMIQITLTGGDPEAVNICFDNFRIVPKD